MLSILSFVIALALAYMLVPAFNSLAQRSLTIPISDPAFIAILVSAITLGILADIYPSFFLYAFKPVNVLKGKVALGVNSGFIRSSLVVFQFMISIFLIIGTITVQKQLGFIQNKKLGFKKDQVIILHNTELLEKQKEALKNELLKSPLVRCLCVDYSLAHHGISIHQGRLFEPCSVVEKRVMIFRSLALMDFL